MLSVSGVLRSNLRAIGTAALGARIQGHSSWQIAARCTDMVYFCRARCRGALF